MKNVYRTRTGLEIGCRYQRPMRQLNSDEERIQRVLLKTSGPDHVSMPLYKIFAIARTLLWRKT